MGNGAYLRRDRNAAGPNTLAHFCQIVNTQYQIPNPISQIPNTPITFAPICQVKTYNNIPNLG